MGLGHSLRSLGRQLADARIPANLIRLLDSRLENRMRELGMIAEAFEFQGINDVKGDYLEFGLWQGKTFTYAHRMKRRYRRHDMLLWGFDSFQGLPPIDDGHDNVWSPGEFACSESELRRILRRNGVTKDEYRLIAGYYEESLDDRAHRQLDGRTAAIVYIDCDLYQSTVHVLDFVARYLVNGSVVCFDDYYCYKAAPDQGESRALKEFLAANPGYQFLPWFDYCPVGKSFIVRVDRDTTQP
jgi:O-methyltransferase